MRAMSTLATLLLGLATVVPAWAQSNFGKPREFPFATGSLTVAPSGDAIAIISAFECHAFLYSVEMEEWLGPFSAPNGGRYGTRDNRQAASFEDRMRMRIGWTSIDGNPVLVLNSLSGRAITMLPDRVEETSAYLPQSTPSFDEQTGRMRHGAWTESADARNQILAEYLKMIQPSRELAGLDTPTRDAVRGFPLEPAGIADLHPNRGLVLCRPTERDPIVLINVNTRERVTFPIQNGRPRIIPPYDTGSFSPDGRFVLMQYGYGHADHYAGGCLQLFTTEGRFVEEIAEFHEDVGQPVGFHEWLPSNWIVYGTGKEIVLRKFEGSESRD